MVMPTPMVGPPPSPDLPEDFRVAYNRARTVASIHPKAACAMLRARINGLSASASTPSTNVTRRIARMAKERAIPSALHEALKRLRCVGGDSVRPGSYDDRDDADTAEQLLEAASLLAECIHSTPKRMGAV